jgi:hypothetical protein
MGGNMDATQTARQREGLITLTAMHYIEEHGLLDGAQLNDAKESLRALFLRTSGAETMLRRLIEMLKVRRNMHSTFSRISSTFMAIRRSIDAMEERGFNLRRLIEQSAVSAEASAQFVGPFLSFSIQFLQKMSAFEKVLQKYLVAREQEVRSQAGFRIAQESRRRLRSRLTGSNVVKQGSSTVEMRIENELATSINYDEAEAGMHAAARQVGAAEAEVQTQLKAIHAMCQAVTEPAKRDSAVVKPEDDMLARFAGLPANDAARVRIERPVRELFALYQRADGMFKLDFDRLKHALRRLGTDSSGAYFNAKDTDRDISAKRDKLRKVEALIQFLERAATLATAEHLDTYPKLSKAFSDAIAEKPSAWAFAAEHLLSAKVRAEAEMSSLS